MTCRSIEHGNDSCILDPPRKIYDYNDNSNRGADFGYSVRKLSFSFSFHFRVFRFKNPAATGTRESFKKVVTADSFFNALLLSLGSLECT